MFCEVASLWTSVDANLVPSTSATRVLAGEAVGVGCGPGWTATGPSAVCVLPGAVPRSDAVWESPVCEPGFNLTPLLLLWKRRDDAQTARP